MGHLLHYHSKPIFCVMGCLFHTHPVIILCMKDHLLHNHSTTVLCVTDYLLHNSPLCDGSFAPASQKQSFVWWVIFSSLTKTVLCVVGHLLQPLKNSPLCDGSFAPASQKQSFVWWVICSSLSETILCVVGHLLQPHKNSPLCGGSFAPASLQPSFVWWVICSSLSKTVLCVMTGGVPGTAQPAHQQSPESSCTPHQHCGLSCLPDLDVYLHTATSVCFPGQHVFKKKSLWPVKQQDHLVVKVFRSQ